MLTNNSMTDLAQKNIELQPILAVVLLVISIK